jgi:hypothetical protein
VRVGVGVRYWNSETLSCEEYYRIKIPTSKKNNINKKERYYGLYAP